MEHDKCILQIMALFLLYAPWQISFLFATWQISFAPGHGKYSLCIMKIIVYGSWHFLFYIFILLIMPGNYSLCIFLISGSWSNKIAIFHGKYSLCIMEFILYGSWHFFVYRIIVCVHTCRVSAQRSLFNSDKSTTRNIKLIIKSLRTLWEYVHIQILFTSLAHVKSHLQVHIFFFQSTPLCFSYLYILFYVAFLIPDVNKSVCQKEKQSSWQCS